LEEAINEMEKSELIRETLGEHIFTKYIEAKRKEWEDYRTKITPWEIEHYLTKY
jgi:glutamine synthetase